MQTARASTRRAALAAFLLFAAGLFVVGPAEASRTTTDLRTIVAPSPSLELLSLTSVDPAESSPRFGFGEDLGLLDPEAGPGGFVVFAAEAAQCELTYARNNPLKYVDPDGREWVHSSRIGSDREFVINAMVEYVRRPGGHERFLEIATSSTRVVVGTRSLNDLDAIKVGDDVRFGDTTPPMGDLFRMDLDPNAILRFGSKVEKPSFAHDPAGVTTLGHEIHHVLAGIAGGFLAMKDGDRPDSARGDAQKEGRRIYSEKKTRTEEEAREIVRKHVNNCTPGERGCL